MNSERERIAQHRLQGSSKDAQPKVPFGRRCQNWLQSVLIPEPEFQLAGLRPASPDADKEEPSSLSKLGESLLGGDTGRAPVCRERERTLRERFEVDGVTALDDFPAGKRIADVVLIIITTPLWLPLMGAIACWIRIVSDGPVFFRQKRVGYGERRFPLLKFRSMDAGADTQVHEKHVIKLMREGKPLTKLDLQGDSRLIPGGFHLRALGLDELPQLFNVLTGEMSLIGPRPCTPSELSQYDETQRERFLARPGLTGYWQVNGKNRTTFAEMVALDIDYRRHRSAILDLAILIQTGPALFMQLAEAKAGLTARAVEPSEDSIEAPRGSDSRYQGDLEAEEATAESQKN